MKFKVYFLVLIFMSTIQLTFAENEPDSENAGKYGAISGRILDNDKLALPGATVLIVGTYQGVTSDVNGFYRFPKLEDGIYKIQVSYIGFTSQLKEIAVKQGETSENNFYLKVGINLDEVVVNGGLQGQSKALNQQKNNVNVSNIISADQVGRFPDQNVGDALKRIPGINVQYDQGEARFGNIRGTSPEYNSVTIDGDRIPSAEAETRSVQLDLIPSDMVQTIEVNKVVTSDMDADAIGGSINMITKSNPYGRRISGTVAGSYGFFSGIPTINGGLLYADRFFNNKLGITLSGTIQNSQLGSDNIEAEWTKNDDGNIIMNEFQVRTYQVQRLRQSYSANFDYEINANHKLEASVVYNHRNDWENRFRTQYKDLDDAGNSSIIRETKGGTNKNARLEDQRIQHYALKGEHHIGALNIDWKASYSKASEDRPNERYISHSYKNLVINQDISNTEKPQVIISDSDAADLNSNWNLKGITEEHQYTDEIDKSFRINLELPLSKDGKSSVLKFGGKYKMKNKYRGNNYYSYEPVDESKFNTEAMNFLSNKTKNNFLAGNYKAGHYINSSFLGNLQLNNSNEFNKEQVLEELANNFDASENVAAGYIRFDQSFKKLHLVFGIRAENTYVNYSGYELIIDEEGNTSDLKKTETQNNNYINILPSLMAKYNFSPNTQVKFGWTNTIARPRYFDLVPYVNINREDNELSIGNPDLKATTSMNFDLMIEHYYANIGMVSAGLFYKDIKDFIVKQRKDNYEYMGNTWEQFTQAINAGNASLWGIETAFQRQLDFLPGFLKQFGIYANYTYTKSAVSNFQIEGRANEDLSLTGTPKHNVNASLAYEGKKLSARLSYNFASAFIEEYGDDAFEDRYYNSVSYLDFNTSYNFNKKFTIFAEVNNILNTPLSYYQGNKKYMMQAEYYNVRCNLGLKFNL
ncbi:MAG: TonB-dependent receptor [Mangrovibacterium sp.]